MRAVAIGGCGTLLTLIWIASNMGNGLLHKHKTYRSALLFNIKQLKNASFSASIPIFDQVRTGILAGRRGSSPSGVGCTSKPFEDRHSTGSWCGVEMC